jgi:hypothetical protein
MPRKRDNEQSKLFIEKAREIGCEDGADANDDKIMLRLARQERTPPKGRSKPKAKKTAR